MKSAMMRKFLLLFLLTGFLPGIAASQQLRSGVYDWNKLAVVKTHTGTLRKIMKGPTRSLESIEVKAVSMRSGKMTHSYMIGGKSDELIIIKEGTAEISINSHKNLLSAGSIAVASDGNQVIIKNPGPGDMVYYSIVFRPKPAKAHISQGKKHAGFFSSWDTITFVATSNGGRRNIIKQPTSALKQLEIHTTMLKEGLPSHAAHNHPDEELILVRYGTVDQTLNGKHNTMGPGSLFFASNDDEHGISNSGKGACEYYAIRWLTY
jgi:uncharacterized cupin superfamily protein